MSNTNTIDREAWLTLIGEALLDDYIVPLMRDAVDPYFEPPKVRFSIGYPHKRNNKKELGGCEPRAKSTDGTNEIFVSPTIDDSLQVSLVLMHELLHACLDSGQADDVMHYQHGPVYQGLSKALGFKNTRYTDVTDALASEMRELFEHIGVLPHEKINDKIQSGSKQKSRWRKVQCNNCGGTSRWTKKQVKEIEYNFCVVCGEDDVLSVEHEHDDGTKELLRLEIYQNTIK